MELLLLEAVLEGGLEDVAGSATGCDVDKAGAVNRSDASTVFRASRLSSGSGMSSYRGRLDSFRRFDRGDVVDVVPPPDPEEETGWEDEDDEPTPAGAVNRSEASTMFRASMFKSGMSSMPAGPDDVDVEESPFCGPRGRCRWWWDGGRRCELLFEVLEDA